ncbi:MAG: ExbD/TolR family protein [Phycisphaeraceae bacterium JB051]
MQHMQLKSRTAIRFNPKVPGKAATPGVAPLVDIVFLLICFYLFVTQSLQSLDERSVELPIIEQSQSQELLPAEIVINLLEDGSVVVAHEPMSINELAMHLRASKRYAMDIGQELRVVIRADRNQTFDKLDTLMDVSRRAGLDMIILRAQDQDRGGSR